MDQSGLMFIAALSVVTYTVYMVCHVLQGSLVPDGIVLSSILFFLGAVAGINIGDRFQQQKVGQEPTSLGIVQGEEPATQESYIR